MLGAPIIKALLGKAVRARTTALTRPAASGCWARCLRRRRWKSCDTLLIVGTSFPYIEFLPKPGQARGVQIDSIRSGSACAIRSDVGAGRRLEADAASAAAALKRNSDRELPGKSAEGHEGLVAS